MLVDPTDSNYVYGTYFGVSPYRITDGGAAFFTNQFITGGHQPGRPVGVLHPLVHEPAATPTSCSSARTGSTAPTTPRRRSAGDVTWKPISPDLTTGCTGTAPERRPRLRAVARSASAAATRVYTGIARRPGLPQPGRAVTRLADLDAGRQRTPAEPAGRRSSRSTASNCRDRLRRVQRLQRGDARARPATSSRRPTAASTGTTSAGNLPDTPVNSLHPRPVVRRTRSTPARTSGRS